MSDLSSRALAARLRAAKRWYVYLILCRNGAVYTGIARDVAVRYAQHVAGTGTGARYTRANPPRRLLVKFACVNQSEAGRMEAAIKKLGATSKRIMAGKIGAARENSFSTEHVSVDEDVVMGFPLALLLARIGRVGRGKRHRIVSGHCIAFSGND